MDLNDFIEELKYELRMLLGAALIVELLNKHKMGNVINYFKDSVYLHSRNIYNFFSNKRNDAKIANFGFGEIVFDLNTYAKWENALHRHVIHVKSERTSPNNVIDGEHLNEQIKLFADDIVDLWNTWIISTSDPNTKELLERTLKAAQKEAKGDCAKVRGLLV